MRFENPSPRGKNDDERILPLINVVFLLLIFFMIAGELSATDPFHVSPPASVSENKLDNKELIILVGNDGQLAIDGETMDEAAFQAAIEQKASLESPPLIWLKVDGQAEADRMVVVMEWLRDAGLENLKLLTLPSGS